MSFSWSRHNWYSDFILSLRKRWMKFNTLNVLKEGFIIAWRLSGLFPLLVLVRWPYMSRTVQSSLGWNDTPILWRRDRWTNELLFWSVSPAYISCHWFSRVNAWNVWFTITIFVESLLVKSVWSPTLVDRCKLDHEMMLKSEDELWGQFPCSLVVTAVRLTSLKMRAFSIFV